MISAQRMRALTSKVNEAGGLTSAAEDAESARMATISGSGLSKRRNRTVEFEAAVMQSDGSSMGAVETDEILRTRVR